jgi:hypothetical protein
MAAVAEDDRRRERRQEVDEREVEAVEDDRLLVRLTVVGVDLVEVALVRPLMSSARVAVTRPRRSRTAR